MDSALGGRRGGKAPGRRRPSRVDAIGEEFSVTSLWRRSGCVRDAGKLDAPGDGGWEQLGCREYSAKKGGARLRWQPRALGLCVLKSGELENDIVIVGLIHVVKFPVVHLATQMGAGDVDGGLGV